MKTKRIAASDSLYNYSLMPSWCHEEIEVLRLAIIKFGFGNWKAIKKSKCLLGKNTTQIVLQAQRLIGQQSILEFNGLHIDVNKIKARNAGRVGVKIKNGLIKNSGIYSRSQILEKRIQNKALEEEKAYYESIVLLEKKLPAIQPDIQLESLKSELILVRKEIEEIQKAIAAKQTLSHK